MQLREKLQVATRTEILIAAEAVLAERGVHASSMALIAKTAGISVGCLYNYFKEKEQLITHIIETRKNELLALIEIETNKNKKEDFFRKIIGFIKVVVEYLSFNVSYSKIVFSSDMLIAFSAKGLNSSGHELKPASILEEFIYYLNPIIKQGEVERIIKKKLVKYYSYMLLGLIRGVFEYRVYVNLFSPQEDITLIIETFLSGVKINGYYNSEKNTLEKSKNKLLI